LTAAENELRGAANVTVHIVKWRLSDFSEGNKNIFERREGQLPSQTPWLRSCIVRKPKKVYPIRTNLRHYAFRKMIAIKIYTSLFIRNTDSTKKKKMITIRKEASKHGVC